jgi:hypothetical protein
MIAENELQGLYEDYVEHRDPDFREGRREKESQLNDLLSHERLEGFEEGDLRELVRNLWAFEIWSNKDYLVGQILEDGIDHVRETLRRGLFGAESRAEKFDVLEKNLKQFGPAVTSEVLTFLFPERCAIYNDRGERALERLGVEDLPVRINNGERYDAYCERMQELSESLHQLPGRTEPPRDLLEVDWFLYYLSTLESGSPSPAAPKTGSQSPRSESTTEADFDHDEIQQELIEIGDGLGFDVDDEYAAAPGARIDVRWSTKVANLGVISYAFEVHRHGSRASAITNLQKVQNSDPSVQRLIIVSDEDELEKCRAEINAISADLAETVSFMEIGRVERANELIGELKGILQAVNLMNDFS